MYACGGPRVLGMQEIWVRQKSVITALEEHCWINGHGYDDSCGGSVWLNGMKSWCMRSGDGKGMQGWTEWNFCYGENKQKVVNLRWQTNRKWHTHQLSKHAVRLNPKWVENHERASKSHRRVAGEQLTVPTMVNTVGCVGVGEGCRGLGCHGWRRSSLDGEGAGVEHVSLSVTVPEFSHARTLQVGVHFGLLLPLLRNFSWTNNFRP